MFDGTEGGLCAGQSSSSTSLSKNHFFMDLTLCTGGDVMLTGKSLPQKVIYILLYVVALIFPSTETKEHSPNHKKKNVGPIANILSKSLH